MFTYGALENFAAKFAAEKGLPSGGLFFVIMAVTVVRHAIMKVTRFLAFTGELLGLAASLSGAGPKFSGWSSRLSLGSLAVLLLTGFLVVWGMYQMTIQISSLLMKNQELAMQVSLLNQENERIIKELERLTGKQARDL